MKHTLILTLALTLTSTLFAAERGTLIFEDDFNRKESAPDKEEVGKGWSTNSKSRAKGNKQVTLKDGAMHIAMHAEADHAVSVVHDAAFRDGAVELRFLLESDMDSLGLDFADLDCKEVHAGHLFRVTVSTKNVAIDDMKTGGMNLKFEEAKKAKTLTDEQKAFLATTKKTVPAKLAAGKWYALLVTITGKTVTASVDGKEVASFSSEGFAHPTKKLLRLSVPHQAVVDDVKIFSTGAAK